jgi:hypothetical protein
MSEKTRSPHKVLDRARRRFYRTRLHSSQKCLSASEMPQERARYARVSPIGTPRANSVVGCRTYFNREIAATTQDGYKLRRTLKLKGRRMSGILCSPGSCYQGNEVHRDCLYATLTTALAKDRRGVAGTRFWSANGSEHRLMKFLTLPSVTGTGQQVTAVVVDLGNARDTPSIAVVPEDGVGDSGADARRQSGNCGSTASETWHKPTFLNLVPASRHLSGSPVRRINS